MRHHSFSWRHRQHLLDRPALAAPAEQCLDPGPRTGRTVAARGPRAGTDRSLVPACAGTPRWGLAAGRLRGSAEGVARRSHRTSSTSIPGTCRGRGPRGRSEIGSPCPGRGTKRTRPPCRPPGGGASRPEAGVLLHDLARTHSSRDGGSAGQAVERAQGDHELGRRVHARRPTRDAELTARLAPCPATDVDRGGSLEAEATGTQGARVGEDERARSWRRRAPARVMDEAGPSRWGGEVKGGTAGQRVVRAGGFEPPRPRTPGPKLPTRCAGWSSPGHYQAVELVGGQSVVPSCTYSSRGVVARPVSNLVSIGGSGPVRSRMPPALRSSATRDRSAGRVRQGRSLPATYVMPGALELSWASDSANLATQSLQMKISVMMAKVLGSLTA